MTGVVGWLSTSLCPTASCTYATSSRPCVSLTPRTSAATAPSTPTAPRRQTARQSHMRMSRSFPRWERSYRSRLLMTATPIALTTTEMPSTAIRGPPPPTATTQTAARPVTRGSSLRCPRTRRKRKGRCHKGGNPGAQRGGPRCCGNATCSPWQGGRAHSPAPVSVSQAPPTHSSPSAAPPGGGPRMPL